MRKATWRTAKEVGVIVLIAGLVFLGLAMAGCAAKHPYQGMEATYNLTMQLVNDAHAAGLISDEDYLSQVLPAHRVARQAIEAARAAEAKGDNAGLAAAQAAFDSTIAVLRAAREKAEQAPMRPARPAATGAALDLLGILLMIDALTKLLGTLTGLAGKVFRGEELTAEEAATLEAEYQRIGDETEARAVEIQRREAEKLLKP